MAHKVMIRQSRPDVLDLLPEASSRSRSVDSAANSNPPSSNWGISPLTDVSPDPAYIAASAATQIVTTDHEEFFQALFNEGIVNGASASIMVTPQSLKLINQFLDYLLWSFLAAGKATTLSKLRPAVSEVLRSRLAKEAILGAEAELEEYLGEEEDEELYQAESPEDFDLEKSWKKTRLRCMVYSSLGDLEEDDEDAYSESDYPHGSAEQPMVVSPAVAIFLTAILEFVGEQTLLVAGHATVARFSQARINAATNIEDGRPQELLPVDRPVVEELDAEKVALNPVLGRMWRQWRKAVRSPESIRAPSQQAFSRRGSRRTSIQSMQSLQSIRAAMAAAEIDDAHEDAHALDAEGEQDNAALVRPPIITQELVDHGLLTPSKSLLRRRASEEKMQYSSMPLPLTPILETPSIIDSEGRKRLTLTLGTEIAEDGGLPFLLPGGVSDGLRPLSMPPNTTIFDFPFREGQATVESPATAKDSMELPDRPTYQRVRSNSLPLPGAFPHSPDEMDFLGSFLKKKRQLMNEDGLPTPVQKPQPFFPVTQQSEMFDEENEPQTDVETNYTTDADYDTDNLTIHSALSGGDLNDQSRVMSLQLMEAQTVRIIANDTPPAQLRVQDRKSAEMKATLITSLDHAREEPVHTSQEQTRAFEPNENHTSEVRMDSVSPREAPEVPDVFDHDGQEIGIARTSDLFIPPVSLPIPVTSPVLPHSHRNSFIMGSKHNSIEEAELLGKDIAKQRRRKSRFYVPAPPPAAPNVYPEHHTGEEVQRQSNLRGADQVSATKELKEPIYPSATSEDEYDDDDEPQPQKRPTIRPSTASRTTTSEPKPSQSPTYKTSVRSMASSSSDSLSHQSMSSTTRSVDTRGQASLELARKHGQARERSSTSSAERAGVRAWTPPATPDLGARTKRSASFSKNKGHARNGSVSSQTSHKLKNLITGRPATAEARSHSRQSASDNDSIMSEQHAALVAKTDERQKSFEQLIQSGATLQYTLTPENLKKMDLPSPTTSLDRPRTATADLAQIVNENTARPVTGGGVKRTQSLTKSKAGTPTSPQMGNTTTTLGDTAREMGPPPISLRTRSPRVGQSPYLGQGPRAMSNIVEQPNSPMSPIIPISPISRQVAEAIRSRPVVNANGVPISPRSFATPTSPHPDDRIDRVPIYSSSTGSKRYVAREASGPTSVEATAALIEFFRNTNPPQEDDPRTLKAVNSGRTTLNTQGPQDLGIRSDSLSSSPDRNISSNINQSYPSSFASQTELIKKKEPIRRQVPPPPRQQSQPSRTVQPIEHGGPVRKQTRVRDPYAIDTDDEEDEEEEDEEEDDEPIKPKPKAVIHSEESLMDFLNSAPPPPVNDTPPQPFISLQKKSSAINLIGRFSRSQSTSSPTPGKITKANVSKPIVSNDGQPPSRQGTPRIGTSNGLSQTSQGGTRLPPSKPLPVKPVPPDYVEPALRSANNDSGDYRGPRGQPARRPMIQPRGATTHGDSMDGLADFLRYTGPPTPEQEFVQPPPPSQDDETKSSRWRSMTSRKNKHVGAV